MKALIIIDVQNDFMPGGPLEVSQGNVIVPLINRLQKQFDLVVTTQDWHPQDHKSFASNHLNRKPFEKTILNGLEQVLWPDHCVQGSKGAEFHSGLETKKVAANFRKGMDSGTDSYSGFFDNGHNISTGLSGYLKEKRITELYFCGLTSDICVYYTIKDSLQEGFAATLIEDTSRPLNNTDYLAVKKHLTDLGVRIIQSSKINLAEHSS